MPVPRLPGTYWLPSYLPPGDAALSRAGGCSYSLACCVWLYGSYAGASGCAAAMRVCVGTDGAQKSPVSDGAVGAPKADGPPPRTIFPLMMRGRALSGSGA